MKTNLPIALLCGLSLSLIGWPDRLAAELAPGGDQDPTQEKSISVELASGRTFVGQLDARTDPEHLWLRSPQGAAVLRRPIRWDRVVQVRVADQDLSGEEFRQVVEAVKQEAPDQTETPTPQKKIVIKGTTRSGGFLSVTRGAPRKPPQRPQVRSLAVEAAVANWDADVEVDGLLVYVYPLDGTGAVVPSRGTLQFDLTGRKDATVSHSHLARRGYGILGPWRSFTTLGRWTRRVRVEDFGPRGAVYRLPFQGVHPEFDLTVAPRGALHARLSVAGQGTFDTTESMLRIRPYSSVRDQLQLSTGRRFFPQERTGRGAR
ncbi:MAG: hypothetical protein ACYSWU_04665 [Planctomycetota bacterium]|jgi:hypothetical protein